MKALAIISVSIALTGCASHSEQPSRSNQSSNPSWAESIRERQRQLEAADAQARATGDDRPYPAGWPRGTLPRNHDPRIVESIRLGQTMEDVVKIMGAEGWSIEDTRDKFLSSSWSSCRLDRSSKREPADWKDLQKKIPLKGHFIEWRYQGFPTTADWIIVFFASPQTLQDSQPRVIARGVFGLGCF